MSRANRSTQTAPPYAGRFSERELHLLRYSHIFASVVREILELKFLEEVSRDSLTLLQFHLLKVITHNGDHQVCEVANFLGVSPPATTRNIDKLERLGLIVRTPSKGDRRATLLSPSAKGRRLVQRYEDLKADRLVPVFEEFSPKELEQFVRLLERFALRLIRQEHSDQGLCLRCAAYRHDDCPVGKIQGGCPYQKARAARLSEANDEDLS